MTDSGVIQAQSCRSFVVFDWEQVDAAADSLMMKHLSNHALVFHHFCKSLSDNESQIQENKIKLWCFSNVGPWREFLSYYSSLQLHGFLKENISHDTEEQYRWNHSRWVRNCVWVATFELTSWLVRSMLKCWMKIGHICFVIVTWHTSVSCVVSLPFINPLPLGIVKCPSNTHFRISLDHPGTFYLLFYE